MDFIIEHTYVGIDLWVILAAILLIAVVVFYFYRRNKIKKVEEELEDELAGNGSDMDEDF